jgi:glutaredoxin
VVALDTILVFTADGCQHCRALCEDFDRRGVVYREINLSREPGEMAHLRELIWEHR